MSSAPLVEITDRGFAGPCPEPGYLDDLVADMEAVSGPMDESLVDESLVDESLVDESLVDEPLVGESLVDEMTARYFK